jgi:tRNA-splicing ligase RtcB
MPVKGTLGDARRPVKIWSDLATVEPAALNQLRNTANLPFVFKWVAAMPDVHLGTGATVGSVIATKGAICPAAVGVDIGCGMCAVRTDVAPERVLDQLPRLRKLIEERIPVGFESNPALTKSVEAWSGWSAFAGLSHTDEALRKRAAGQLGTLGGGNHFIEICLDAQRRVWLMLHSGSRNLGKVLAERHIDTAKGLMKQMFIDLPDPALAYLVQGTPEFDRYLNDLLWAQEYAAENRREMMRRLEAVLAEVAGPFSTSDEVNCHHNYVAAETHYGEDVLVTRKGAVRAGAGELGIIPGSMGARSFIVRGKGSAESFCSCSHGAGRRMSRGEAKKRFTVADLARETQGVECRKDDGVVDEIPSAYKDIDEVMANQSDLVEVVAELKQVLCVKG